MISETEWVFERAKLYQIMRDHPDWSLRQCGRELGHDLKWVRKWQQRFQEASQLTLEVFTSRLTCTKDHPHPNW